MLPSVTSYRLPKNGNSMEECEDAFHFSTEQLRFAVADGATESSYSDRWAQSLVKCYVDDPPFGFPPTEDALQLWLLPQQTEWHSNINWATLEWYAQEKAERGAYAAFVGVQFSAYGTLWQKVVSKTLCGEVLAWNAFAVGDCNLFQVRADELIRSFPIEKSEHFNSRPILLASNVMHNGSALKEIRSADGGCKPNDVILLASDALAKWFLAEHEGGRKPWRTLLDLGSESEFELLVAKCRTSQTIRNDDTTLMTIRWSE